MISSKNVEDDNTRPVEFSCRALRDRNLIERLIVWLKESRRVLTRFEMTAINFLTMAKLACLNAAYDL